jgi:outer membrane lipoprotein carrier protein
MRKPTLAAAFLLASSALALATLSAPVALAQMSTTLPPAADVVAKVQAFYNATQSFRSDFDQSYLVKAYNQTKTSHGQVVFNKPGKMNWTYSNPAGNRVVSDGTTLWVYEQQNNQVYQSAVSATQYPAALSFLTGQGQLDATFNFTIHEGDGQFGFPGGWVLIGTPKTPTAAYSTVVFYVDKATSQIRRVLIVDGQGNRNRFDFLTPVVNQPVNPNEFVFVAPPGATVIRP